MPYIEDWTGVRRELSEEFYELIEDVDNGHYPKGLLLQRIAGVDDSKVVGYHFSAGYHTYHIVGRREATFLGFEDSKVRKVEDLAEWLLRRLFV